MNKPVQHALIRQARAWAREIDATLATRAQLTKHGVLVVLLITGVLGVTLGAHSTWLKTQGGGAVHQPVWGFLSGVVCLAMAVWVSRRVVLAPAFLVALMGVVTTMNVVAVAANGLVATIFLPGLIMFAHVLVSPQMALGASLILLLAVLGCLVGLHPEVSGEFLSRIAGSGMGVLSIMQLLTRHWRSVGVRFAGISRDMFLLIEDLGGEVVAARSATEVAQNTDEHSGLPNRRGFAAVVTEQIHASRLESALYLYALQFGQWHDSIAALDVDKQQSLLQKLVSTLRDLFGEHAVIARTGEANFLVLLSDPGWEDAQFVAFNDQVMNVLKRPVTLGRLVALTQPRVGCCQWPRNGLGAAVLMQRAELAVLMAGQDHIGRVCRFDPVMETRIVDRARLTAEIGQGLSLGQFELYFQPIVLSAGGRCTKAEALIRWSHPVRGRVSPADFIPLAEQSELIIDITDWVLETSVRQVKAWREQIDPAFRISVNMPPSYLTRHAADPGRFLQQFIRLDVPAGSIVLEITEGMMLNVTPDMIMALTTLREAGFLIALDDFGTGYSSFGQLHKLPLDFLKIDKSFVDELASGPQHRAVCASIIQVAHELGMAVVAEGVETGEQLAHLKAMQCDFLQGYFIAKPMPAEALVAGHFEVS